MGKTDELDEIIPELSEEEAWAIFDEHARYFLNMSGKEFLAAWKAGKFRDRLEGEKEDPDVIDVAMLIPFVEEGIV